MYHAWRSFDSLRDHDRVRAWLLQILRHRHHHWLRTQSRRVKTVADSNQLNQEVDQVETDVLARISNQELLQRSLDELEIKYKEPFLLVFLEGMTCREAASALDLPLGTVLSRIHRARIKLRGTARKLDPDFENTDDSLVSKEPPQNTETDGNFLQKLSNENE